MPLFNSSFKVTRTQGFCRQLCSWCFLFGTQPSSLQFLRRLSAGKQSWTAGTTALVWISGSPESAKSPKSCEKRTPATRHTAQKYQCLLEVKRDSRNFSERQLFTDINRQLIINFNVQSRFDNSVFFFLKIKAKCSSQRGPVSWIPKRRILDWTSLRYFIFELQKMRRKFWKKIPQRGNKFSLSILAASLTSRLGPMSLLVSQPYIVGY